MDLSGSIAPYSPGAVTSGRTARSAPWPADAPTSPQIAQQSYLDDGTPIRLRLLDAGDSADILAFFEALSPRSMYQRFQLRRQSLSPALIRLLCGMDGQRHVAVGAFADEGMIGTGRYVCSDENTAVAEVAFTVADTWQGRGVGRRLLRTLASAAHERGVDTFRFTVLVDNLPATRLLAVPGFSAMVRSGQLEGQFGVAEVLS